MWGTVKPVHTKENGRKINPIPKIQKKTIRVRVWELFWWNASCRIQKTHQRKAWPQRRRKSTLTVTHICHCTRIPFWHVLIKHSWTTPGTTKHCKRWRNKKKERPTHHKPQERYRCKTKQITERVRIVIRWNSSCRIRKTQWLKRLYREEKNIALTAFHSCHRTRTPSWYVLVEHRCFFKHCKRGCNKEREEKITPTTRSTCTVPKANRIMRELWSDKSRVVIWKTQWRSGTERRKIALTAWHTCHRTRIPCWHVLIEHICSPKHCKRGRHKQRKNEQPTHTNTRKKRFRKQQK